MRFDPVKRQNRRGVAAVEFAIVAVPFFLLTLACFEICRGMMVVSTMNEAARAGCRVAVLRGATTSLVEQEVADFLSISKISSHKVTILPTSLAAAQEWEPVTVTVSSSFSDISWVPVPRFLGGRIYSAACTLPAEGGSG